MDYSIIQNKIDNENLNSTNSVPPMWHRFKFTMVIDIFSIFDEGVDYRMDLSGEKVNSNITQWKQVLSEISSASDSNKTISVKSFNKSPYEGKDFVNFNVDLKSISNPQKYRLLFYLTDEYVKDGRLCRMVDSTNWLPAPPPEFNIIVSPNSIFMRPGEHRNIVVTISGNTEFQSNGRLNVNKTKKKMQM